MLALPIILLSLFLIFFFSIVVWKGFTKKRVLIAFLLATGCSLVFAGISHIFVPDIVANNIGWDVCPEFQYEIGIANILIGTLLILSFYFDNQWILAAIVASTIWGWGNALGHIISYNKHKNKKSGNIGWALYFDIFLPLISIILYLITYVYN
jgi:hypothetical protein